MNYYLAWIVVSLLLVYMAAELSYGGGSNFGCYRRPRDPLWPRWWKRGIYPPEPRDDSGKTPKPSPNKSPEIVD
jgi:hypothetical protein